MKRLCVAVLVTGAALVGLAVPAFADPIALISPGQHNQSCQALAPSSPGRASSAPGSAFNENGGTAGGVYAPIAQYDVACAQVSFHS
jgi:hypothetical protein